MNVILSGAGHGSRLMPLTADEPKCFTTIAGRRIIDWNLDAFRQNGLDRFVFIGGYLLDVVRAGNRYGAGCVGAGRVFSTWRSKNSTIRLSRSMRWRGSPLRERSWPASG